MSGEYKEKKRSQKDKRGANLEKGRSKTDKTPGIPVRPVPEGKELIHTNGSSYMGLKQGIIVNPAVTKEYKPEESFKLMMVNDPEAKNLKQTQEPAKKRQIVPPNLIEEKYPEIQKGGFRARYY